MSVKNVIFVIMLILISFLFHNNSYATLKDIEDHWCKDEIEIMYENGYIEDREEKMFRPDEALTKAEFCMTINKLLNYSDIDDTDSDWTEKHFAVGIEKGYMPIGSADDTLTREEACVIFERIADITIEDAFNGNVFEDYLDYENVSVWAEKSVRRLVINGKIIGYTDNTLKMKNKLTRAEFVKIVTRFDETLETIESKKMAISLHNLSNRFNNIETFTSITKVRDVFGVENINYIIQKKKMYVELNNITAFKKSIC